MAKTKTLVAAEAEARDCVNRWALWAGGTGFIPGMGLLIGGYIDFEMVREIARIYGVEEFDAQALATSIAATVAGRAASETLSFIPIAGWIVKAGVAASVTKAAGELCMNYFRDRSPYK